MKKMKKLTAAVLTVGMLAAMPASTVLAEDEGYSVGFVTFGLGGDFFQSLADTFVETMEGAGWEAQYADGQYDPSAQMEAAENFIAMGWMFWCFGQWLRNPWMLL